MNAYWQYVGQTRTELLELKRGSKAWWTKARGILQDCKASTIPALQNNRKEWVMEPQGKPDVFANTFQDKYKLPDTEVNKYSELEQTVRESTVQKPTVEAVCQVLGKMQEHSATGPDLLPSKILKVCAAQLAEPIRRLVYRMLDTGEWPETWLQHWITPIFKRAAVFKPTNYRGVHLTAQISKAVERIIACNFTQHLTATIGCGPNQFAYEKERGCRDALANMVLIWLEGMDRHLKIGLYCSDVSAAFDKVCAERLCEKLRAKGICEQMVQLILQLLL